MLPLDPVTPASLVRTTVVAAEVDTEPTTPTSANLLLVAPSSDASSLFSFQIRLRFFHVFFKSFFFAIGQRFWASWIDNCVATSQSEVQPARAGCIDDSLSFDLLSRLSGPVISCFCSRVSRFENQPWNAWVGVIRARREGNRSVIGESESSTFVRAR